MNNKTPVYVERPETKPRLGLTPPWNILVALLGATLVLVIAFSIAATAEDSQNQATQNNLETVENHIRNIGAIPSIDAQPTPTIENNWNIIHDKPLNVPPIIDASKQSLTSSKQVAVLYLVSDILILSAYSDAGTCWYMRSQHGMANFYATRGGAKTPSDCDIDYLQNSYIGDNGIIRMDTGDINPLTIEGFDFQKATPIQYLDFNESKKNT